MDDGLAYEQIMKANQEAIEKENKRLHKLHTSEGKPKDFFELFCKQIGRII